MAKNNIRASRVDGGAAAVAVGESTDKGSDDEFKGDLYSFCDYKNATMARLPCMSTRLNWLPTSDST